MVTVCYDSWGVVHKEYHLRRFDKIFEFQKVNTFFMDHRLLSQYLVFCPGFLNLAGSSEKRDYVVQEVGVVQHARLRNHIEHIS